MRFTELLPEIQAAYPERDRRFHVIATRFYLGAESLETLRSLALWQPTYRSQMMLPILTDEEVETIINNR